MDTFLKGMKLSQLQVLCGKGAIRQDGDRAQLIARVATAANVADIDFNTAELDNLSYMQLLGKCVCEGLPTQGRR